MSEQHQPKYFPRLAILDTQEILEKVPADQWKLVEFPRRHSNIQATDKILTPWVYFCDNTIRGSENGDVLFQAVRTGKAPKDFMKRLMDEPANESLSLYVKALGDKAGKKQKILAVQSAFAMLLSDQVKSTLPETVIPEINVDTDLRAEVNLLVSNMYRLAMYHQAHETSERQRIYGDD